MPRLPVALLPLVLIAAAAADQTKNTTSSDGLEPGTTWTEAAAAGGEQDLLKWALSHSDPEELRRAAQEARRGADTSDPEFVERQARVQALLQQLREEPTEAELMQEAVAILSTPSSTPQQLVNAAEALRYLVEPVDNANNLQGMGGLAPLVALLHPSTPPALQAASSHTLGTAASNNHQFQGQLLAGHPEVLHLLLALVERSSDDGSARSGDSMPGGGGGGGGSGGSEESAAAEAVAEAGHKALHALSAILRLNQQRLLGSHSVQVRHKRKALGLLTDLIHADSAATSAAAAAEAAEEPQTAQHPAGQQLPVAALDYSAAVVAALHLLDIDQHPLAEADMDLQEKALLALLAMLDSGAGSDSARSSGAAAAELISDAGGLATLRRLQAGLDAAAVAEEGGAGGTDEGESYARELLGLAESVSRRVAATDTRDAAEL